MRELHHHQNYVVQEYVEAYLERRLGRRELLARVLAVTGSIPLSAAVLVALGCGDSADQGAAVAPTASPEAATTSSPTPAAAAANDPAIEARDVSFPGPASEMKAYLARPSAAGSYPGIIVIHENRGLLEHFKDVSRRYAREGFVALAVDLVSRRGGTTADTTANMAALRATAAEFIADLTAGVEYLKHQTFVRANALGVTGFCFGGGFTWELAIANPDIKAGVAYYGTVSGASLEHISRTNAALLGIYGANDPRVTAQSTDIAGRLQSAGKSFEIKVFEGASHAFFNDTGSAYNAAAAQEAWALTLAWFRKYLTG